MELKDIVAEAIEKQLKDSFTRGICAGWTACATYMYKQCNKKTSASDIKKFLKIESEKVQIMESLEEFEQLNTENSN